MKITDNHIASMIAEANLAIHDADMLIDTTSSMQESMEYALKALIQLSDIAVKQQEEIERLQREIEQLARRNGNLEESDPELYGPMTNEQRAILDAFLSADDKG